MTTVKLRKEYWGEPISYLKSIYSCPSLLVAPIDSSNSLHLIVQILSLIEYSRKLFARAFNLIEQELGMAFFESYNSFRGQYVIKLIMDLRARAFKHHTGFKILNAIIDVFLFVLPLYNKHNYLS